MKASEARQLTEQHLRTGEVVVSLLAHCMARIVEAAKKGERQIAHPLHGRTATKNQEEAVLQQLRELGYEVKFHDNYDPRDPRECSYHTVSW